MEEKKKLLVIVDPQYDFIDGTLPVPGAADAMDKLAEYVEKNKENYEAIVVSLDWHPKEHCSFEGQQDSNGNYGKWPVHCLRFSKGASVWQNLMDKFENIDTYMLTKGLYADKEAYSLFQDLDSNYRFRTLMDDHKITDVDFCGIVREVCVQNTLIDFLRIFPEIDPTVLMDFTPALDDGTTFKKFLEENPRVYTI